MVYVIQEATKLNSSRFSEQCAEQETAAARQNWASTQQEKSIHLNAPRPRCHKSTQLDAHRASPSNLCVRVVQLLKQRQLCAELLLGFDAIIVQAESCMHCHSNLKRFIHHTCTSVSHMLANGILQQVQH